MAKKQRSPLDLKRQDGKGRRKPGTDCISCSDKWRPRIRELFEDTIEKGEDYSLVQLCDFLKDCGYPRERCALRYHLKSHEPDLWERWDGRHENAA